MKLRLWWWVIFLALTGGLTGCQTISPSMPNAGQLRPEPARKVSTVAVPIRISAPAIAALVEDKFPAGANIYWTTGQSIASGVTLQMGIYRAGGVDISTDGGCVNLSMVMAIRDARIDWEEKVVFVRVKKHFDFGGSGRVSARVCPSVSSDWRLASTINPSFNWVQGAYVTIGTPIGSFNIGVADKVEPTVREKLNGIAKSISESLGKLPLKDKLDVAWAAVQKPILLAKKPVTPASPASAPSAPPAAQLPDVYLVAEPMLIGLGPLKTDGTEIVATPIISTFIKLQLGKPDPTLLPTPKPLPPNAGPIVPAGVNASVLAVVPYDEANKVAEGVLKNNPIEIGEKKFVTIHGIEVFPDGERLLVKVSFAARLSWLPFEDAKGVLYFRGTPRYSNQDRVLSVENIAFDIDTDNLLVKSAELLKSPIFKRAIEKALRFELGSKLDPIIDQAKGGVAGQQIATGVLLNAKAEAIEVEAMHIGPKAVSVRLNATGNANVVLEPIKP